MDDTIDTPRHLIQSVTELCPPDKTTVFEVNHRSVSSSRQTIPEANIESLDASTSSQTPRSLIDNFVSQQPLEATQQIQARQVPRRSVLTPVPSPRRKKSRRLTLERRVIEKNHVKSLATPSAETPRTLIQANIQAGGRDETPVVFHVTSHLGATHGQNDSNDRSALNATPTVDSPDTPNYLDDYLRIRQASQPVVKPTKKTTRQTNKNRFDISGNFRIPGEAPSSHCELQSESDAGREGGSDAEDEDEDEDEVEDGEVRLEEGSGDDDDDDVEMEEQEAESEAGSEPLTSIRTQQKSSSFQTVYKSQSQMASNPQAEAVISIADDPQEASYDFTAHAPEVSRSLKAQVSVASEHVGTSPKQNTSTTKASISSPLKVNDSITHRSKSMNALDASHKLTPSSKKRRQTFTSGDLSPPSKKHFTNSHSSHVTLEAVGLSTSLAVPSSQAEAYKNISISPIRGIDLLSRRSPSPELLPSARTPSKSRRSSAQLSSPHTRSRNTSKSPRSVSSPSKLHNASLPAEKSDHHNRLSTSHQDPRHSLLETSVRNNRTRSHETTSGSIRDYFRPATGNQNHVVSRESPVGRVSGVSMSSLAAIKTGSHQAHPMLDITPDGQSASPPLNTSTPVPLIHGSSVDGDLSSAMTRTQSSSTRRSSVRRSSADTDVLSAASRRQSSTASVRELQSPTASFVSPPTAFKTARIARTAQSDSATEKRSGTRGSLPNVHRNDDDDENEEEDDDGDEEDEENVTPEKDSERYSRLVTPVLPASSQTMKKRIKTPAVLFPLSQGVLSQPTPKKSSDTAVTSSKPGQGRGRNIGQSKSPSRASAANRLPTSLTKGIFQHFAKGKVSRDVWPLLGQIEDKFWSNLVNDVSAYASHADRTTIKQEDIELLMHRQGLISEKKTLYGLIEEYLPLEYRAELIPMAMSGKVVPSMKKKK